MPLKNKLYYLDPRFEPLALWMIGRAHAKGIELEIFETLRDDEVQMAYFAQGRKELSEVNRLRGLAKLELISEIENHSIITNVQHVSKEKGHGAGLAIDVIPDGNWNAPAKKWAVIGEVVKEANIFWLATLINMGGELIWGGNWKLQSGGADQPHIELVLK